MREHEYLDLELSIEKTEGGGYTSRVLSSPAGQAAEPFTLPFSATELARFMLAVGPPRVSTRGVAASATAEAMDARQFGRRLHDAAFSGEVGTCFRNSLVTAQNAGKGLRVRLRLGQAPDLSPVPWEYLYSGAHAQYLTLSTDTPLVRYLEVSQPIPPLEVEPPLRVLVMVSDPSDVPGLDVDREMELLRATTLDLTENGLMELVFLEQATLPNLLSAIYDRFHVFHFIGHGGFDEAAGEGVLVLEDASGAAHRVTGSRLATVLHNADELRLAVINACEGARAATEDLFSGVAQTLVRQGLPAVVAMQAEISDRAAIAFAHEFYVALCRGYPVDAALCRARLAIYVSDRETEFGTPVLFMRADDGRLFSLAREVDEPPVEQHHQSLYDSAVTALHAGAVTTAVPMLEHLSANHFGDADTLLMQATSPVTDDEPDVTDDERDVTDDERDDGPAGDEGNGHRPSRVGRWVAIAAGFVAVALLGGWLLNNLLSNETRAPGAAADTPVDPRRVTAAYLPEGARLDGGDADWEGVTRTRSNHVVANPTGEQTPVDGVWRVGWNSDALYVLVDVTDPELTQTHADQPSQLWKGDSVSFEFGADPSGLPADAGLRQGDLHLMIGVHAEGRLLAAANRASGGVFRAGSQLTDVPVATVLGPTGYRVEATVPWHVLDVSGPTAGAVFGMNLNVSDAVPSGSGTGELRVMVSSNPDRTAANQPRPGTWHLLELAGPRA